MARDTSFYYAFLMLPAAKRHAIVAVWDFCRAVDDAVDEGARDQAAGELALWRAELDRAFDSSPEVTPVTPQGRALKPLVAAFTLARQPFDDLIDGVAMDLGHDRYGTFADLYEYCRRVASAVGLICIEIFGVRDAAAREYAVNLGVALQLTNIIRDVGVDLARGRVYLPQEDLARFGCTDEDLRRGVPTPPVRALLTFQCARARRYFSDAAHALRRTNARRLVAAEIMAAVYQDILRRVERNGYDVFAQVIRVPRPARAIIALVTWAKTIATSLQRDGLRVWAGRAGRAGRTGKESA